MIETQKSKRPYFFPMFLIEKRTFMKIDSLYTRAGADDIHPVHLLCIIVGDMLYARRKSHDRRS